MKHATYLALIHLLRITAFSDALWNPFMSRNSVRTKDQWINSLTDWRIDGLMD